MKKFLAILLVLIIILTGCGMTCRKTAPKSKGLYPNTAIVIKLNRKTNCVTCRDANGHKWKFYGCEDWMVGDFVSLLMYDNGTKRIKDDQILMVRYSGQKEDF